MSTALVIGSGPAGLMAADSLASAGVAVTLCEAKPSVGRKFLMAGKSGLNLTRNEALEAFLPHYAEAAAALRPMVQAFDAQAVQDWVRGLGQEVFTGSTGRVFPRAMKASPLLRAWLARMDGLGVAIRTRTRWTGWDGDALVFDSPTGRETLHADAVVLALGGASWARLGSDGAWAGLLASRGVAVAPFRPANAGVLVNWSEHMRRHFGAPLKGVGLHAGSLASRGEAVLSADGLEGGGIYAVSRNLREGADLRIDLAPDLRAEEVVARLERPRGKISLANHLRRALHFDPVKIALLQEFARPLPAELEALAARIKALRVPVAGMRPMDQAISTAGGVPFAALTEELMLRDLPGIWCAGEMLDWEAPTGGYLITACLATGRWAGQSAARALQQTRAG